MRSLVAPYTGAWIETEPVQGLVVRIFVAPYTGAWIETRRLYQRGRVIHRSLPTRERGLKRAERRMGVQTAIVAPYTGAWIETIRAAGLNPHGGRRSLHGSVD